MAHDNGGLASTRASVHAVDVRSTDAAGFNSNEDFVFGDLGIGSVTEFKLVVGSESQGFHGEI